MKTGLALLASCVLSAAAMAQTVQVVLPAGITFWQANNEPFAGAAPKRYQQWFAPTQLLGTVGHPVRIVGLDFIAGSPGGQTGAQIDMEMSMANVPGQVPFGFVTQNLVVVVPRRNVTLGPATPGSFPLTLNFKQFGTEFLWDGQSGVVVEIKIFANGRNNQSYQYDFQATFSAFNQISRMWGFGPNPNGITTPSFIQANAGLSMRFNYEEGVSTSFGAGCPGAGGFVPRAATIGGHPLAANAAWGHELTQANSQMSAALLIGGSRTMLAGVSLPLELAAIRAPGCYLLTDILMTLGAVTVGGGAGAGRTQLSMPIPPVTNFYGQSFFTQWVVLDTQAATSLVLSQGMWHIIG